MIQGKQMQGLRALVFGGHEMTYLPDAPHLASGQGGDEGQHALAGRRHLVLAVRLVEVCGDLSAREGEGMDGGNQKREEVVAGVWGRGVGE